jgi:hypothetical protein
MAHRQRWGRHPATQTHPSDLFYLLSTSLHGSANAGRPSCSKTHWHHHLAASGCTHLHNYARPLSSLVRFRLVPVTCVLSTSGVRSTLRNQPVSLKTISIELLVLIVWHRLASTGHHPLIEVPTPTPCYYQWMVLMIPQLWWFAVVVCRSHLVCLGCSWGILIGAGYSRSASFLIIQACYHIIYVLV